MNTQPTPDTSQTWRRRARIASLALATAALVAACGSGSDAGTDASTDETSNETTATTDVELVSDGVPTLSADDPSADEDTSDEDESDGEETNDDDLAPTQQAAVEQFIACMEEEGVDVGLMEDPNATPEELEAMTTSPVFVAAEGTCSPLLEDAFGDFTLDPAVEAAFAERSAEMAACGREVLGIEIPDDILLLDEDDPRAIAVFDYETTPEEEAGIDACFEEILGDLIDEDGNLTAPEEGE